MNSSITVVLTDTAIALVSKNVVLTSIPLRHWTSNNGSTWSGRLRPQTEVVWLIDRLRTVLQNDSDESVMKRVLRVMLTVDLEQRLPVTCPSNGPSRRRRHRNGLIRGNPLKLLPQFHQQNPETVLTL